MTISWNIELLGKKSNRKKGSFTSEGDNWVFSFDGHVKLMDFQNSSFPYTITAIYGCLDRTSRKLVWIKVWDSNSSPYFKQRRI